MSLRTRTEQFISGQLSHEELVELLKLCVSDGGFEAMMCVSRLYEDMYDGFTFNMEIKGPSATALLRWGAAGLDALFQAARRNPSSKNLSLALHILAMAAAGDPSSRFFRLDPDLDAMIDIAITDLEIRPIARSHLAELILSLPDEHDVAGLVGSTLMAFSFAKATSARELFAAVSKRWLATSAPVLGEFEELIKTKRKNEPAFQAFLTRHPQLLDPLSHKVWPQPNLFGFKEPDFIIKRTDGTYLVIEIECPAKALVTAGGHLSAHVTHAEQQATDYRRNLMQKYPDIRAKLPDFQEPDCLVIVGLEGVLSAEQRQVLYDANQNRRHLRIAGFDWLLERGRTIASNVTQADVEVSPLRIV
ncbi:Shedu anti-phage system protein SduA domain-containing protein [Shinella sp.]|uniref:Shedu anti-phage system protein SduA domain-containing protein n=1 Tax=Shinella sp. TaxID=1870904 RepID=UPI003F71BABB